MRAFAGIEQKGMSYRRQNLRGDSDVTGLFEPGVPGDTNVGQLRNFLAAQPGRASAPSSRQPGHIGGDAFAAAAQERSQFPTPQDRWLAHTSQCRTPRRQGPGSAHTWITSPWNQPEYGLTVLVMNNSTLDVGTSTVQATLAPPGLSQVGLAGLLLGAALPVVNSSIVNVALPSLSVDLCAGPGTVEMIVAGYGMAYAMLLVLGGRLGDRFGRRRIYLIGTASFALTSLTYGLAPNAWLLVGARIAQGASAAFMVPQVLAIIAVTTSEARRPRALGLYGAVGGISAVTGQILGGWLIAANIFGTGWRAIFLVNMPITALALVLTAIVVPETRSSRPPRIDTTGTLWLAVTVIAVLVPAMMGQTAGWPIWIWLLIAAAPISALLLWKTEHRAEQSGADPLIPPRALSHGPVRPGLWVAVPFFAAASGFQFVVAIALQQGLHLTAATTATVLAPMATAFFLASLLAPRLITRYGPKTVTIGIATQTIGLLTVLITALVRWPHLDATHLLAGTVILGIGQGVAMPSLFRIVFAGSSPADAGMRSGIMATTQQISMALGVALFGTTLLTLAPHLGMRSALTAALGFAALASAAATALSHRLPPIGNDVNQ